MVLNFNDFRFVILCLCAETRAFGGLGHAVSDASTGEAVPLKSGEISSAEIYDVVKGEKGSAGELCGAIIAGRTSARCLKTLPREFSGSIAAR